MESKAQPGEFVVKTTFASIIFQILLLDMIFFLDSMITAIGMAQKIEIMVVAVIIAVIVMLLGSGIINRFILEHPSIKMLTPHQWFACARLPDPYLPRSCAATCP